MTHRHVPSDDMPQQSQPPHRQQMEQSIRTLLQATGFSLDHPHLRDTPERVAECWLSDLLDGYQQDPAHLLSDQYSAQEDGLVMVHNIDCHGICPHHLLPFFGKVHLAYLPHQNIVGFSRLGQLVRCITHRLTLQETATHQIADALMQHLQAKGAGCVIEAQQLCMCLRQSDQTHSTVVTSCFLGAFQQRTDLQRLLFTPPFASRMIP